MKKQKTKMVSHVIDHASVIASLERRIDAKNDEINTLSARHDAMKNIIAKSIFALRILAPSAGDADASVGKLANELEKAIGTESESKTYTMTAGRDWREVMERMKTQPPDARKEQKQDAGAAGD